MTARSTATVNDSRPTSRIWLLSIVLVTALLRLYRLGDWSFWGDELFTVSGQEDGFDYILLYRSLASTLVQWWTGRVGISEWNARIMPALIGIATVPIFYKLVCQLFSRRVALIAALLLAVSPWHIYWSQNARFYTLLLLFYTAASIFIFRGLDERRGDLLIIGSMLLALAARERLLAFLLLPPIIVFLVMGLVAGNASQQAASKRYWLIFLPVVAIATAFTWPYVTNLEDWMSGFGYPNSNPLRLTASVFFYVGVPIMFFGMIGALLGVKERSSALLWFTLTAIVPLASLAALTPFHYVANRYAFVILSSWLILAAYALDALFSSASRQRGGLVLVLLLTLAMSQSVFDNAMYFTQRKGNRADWQSALTEVASQIEADAIVVSSDHELANYYTGRTTRAIQRNSLDQLQEANVPLWLVVDVVVVEQYEPVALWFDENAMLVASHDVHIPGRTYPMRVYHYQP